MSEKKPDAQTGSIAAQAPITPESARPARLDTATLATPVVAAPPTSTTAVKALIFDMGHVFVKFDWELVCQGFCQRAKVSRQVFNPVLTELKKLGYERGHCDTTVFLGKMNELLGCDISHAEFTVLWNATFEEDTEMASLLQQLGRRYPVYLLSNTNENHYDYLQGNFNVARHFKEKVLSYIVRLAKPDLEIFHHTVALTGLQAHECVFVDDLSENIAAAGQTGLKTVQFVGIADLKTRLVNEYGLTL